jgi:hypothetical protein
MAVAGVPLLGFTNPAQATALLTSLSVVVLIWMATEVRKALRPRLNVGEAKDETRMFEQTPIEVAPDWMDKTAA